ncbi:hypothetical protein AX16_010777 [Volvariella volvacea WC 439]|nr:hypothetical protein AX16_010777 [Volvariella volvacea WC 439]
MVRASPPSAPNPPRPLTVLRTSHSLPSHKTITQQRRGVASKSPELEELYKGNQRFLKSVRETEPEMLKELAYEGQKPPFLFIDCCDSRSNEAAIFSAKPGLMFTAGNIANQFHEHDLNSRSILAYAVEHLKVTHVIIMGHYGCGGVAAAMQGQDAAVDAHNHHAHATTMTEADTTLEDWIAPIREVYLTSDRPEIVERREREKTTKLGPPGLHDPAFRALVEENVKASVKRLASSKIITTHYNNFRAPSHVFTVMDDTATADTTPPPAPTPEVTAPKDVFIHGWVYDIEDGHVSDLGVSVGPPGKSLPEMPFPPVEARRT